MPRPIAPSMVVLAAGFAAGLVYRHLWDDPSAGSVANYLRSGLHGMALGASGWGAHLYFNSRNGGWLRKLPLLAEIAARAFVIAIVVSTVAIALEVC